MIEQSVSLASNGVVKVPGYEQLVRFGYTKNRGVYRLAVTASGEWEGLAIRCFWHVPDGKDPASSLVVDGYVAVPASVTAQPGNGCVTFEGSDGTKTVTSADLRYRVSANSGTEGGTEPEPGTPAWQQLVDAVHTDAAAAEQAKTDAQTAATESAASADKAAGSEKAAGDAQAKAAESLQELKDGIASGNFKGEPGTSPTVTVQDIAGGHRIVITDATGTSSVDVMDGKKGDPGKPGDTGATPELTIGTVEEGDAPSATITGTAKNPVLNLTLKSGAPGKDATVDATLSQSGKAADAKVTGDELARKAVIDDTAVGTDAWSSKHIIDTLCPPLEETGNPVVCYPVAGYPLGVKVTLEPVQEGSGIPSPENIRPIKGRDSVTITRQEDNQVITLTLPETVYGGEVDAVSGDGNNNTKIITLDGNKIKFSQSGNYFNLPLHSAPGASIQGTIYCNHFNSKIFIVNARYEFCFVLASTIADLFTNVDDLNAYLTAQYAAGTPVQITYNLATPTPFTATGAQPIPALSGVNTILTDADSATVTGRADPIKRITDLEDAVASMTTT
jgi:hypothetical protein